MTAALRKVINQPALRVPAPRTPIDQEAQRPRWPGKLAKVMASADVAVLVTTATIGALLGVGNAESAQAERVAVVLAVISVGSVLISLGAFRCWDRRILGQGSEEFNRLIRAYVTCLVVVGLIGFGLRIETVRGWVFVIIPAAGMASMVARYVLRRRLNRIRRRDGRCMHDVLAVGGHDAARDLITRTQRASHFGWKVSGVCTSTGTGIDGSETIDGVPVVGDLSSAASQVRRGGYDIVAVSVGPGWTPRRLQELSWDLEGTGVELVVDPGLMEVAGPRLHVAPVDGLPLLRLSEPRFTGVPRLGKAILDRLFAAVMVVILAPLLLVIAVAVRGGDGGPALFRQRRVGQGGATFMMIKFRSMVVDAEHKRADLLVDNDASGPLFKVHRDPRITRVGAVLRRYSLDELPQILNVLAGHMSFVGPRPPLPAEVDQFKPDARRKLLVRPGMTGLWQVSGRSNLSWEESVRLDLRYVENWSPAMDLLIIWKTIGAVFRGRGAY